MFLQILGAVQSGAPVILATFLCGSMSEVSVLAVYMLVSTGLQMIPNVLGTGLQALFGRQIAEETTRVFGLPISHIERLCTQSPLWHADVLFH